MESEIGENEAVSTAVVRAVSAVTVRKPGSLRPLTDIIDLDALDALFDPPSNNVHQADGRLSFSYSSCRITIDNGEYLTVEPAETTGRLSVQTDGTDQAKKSRLHRDTQSTAPKMTPGSRVCFVCQQPIEREDLHRERGELVHLEYRAELRCGIPLVTGLNVE